jgi:hypothetical protein
LVYTLRKDIGRNRNEEFALKTNLFALVLTLLWTLSAPALEGIISRLDLPD